MKNKNEIHLEELLEEQRWKRTSKKYLWELDKFLDLSDNIKEDDIKYLVITQMIKCDKSLTERAEEIFKKILDKNT